MTKFRIFFILCVLGGSNSAYAAGTVGGKVKTLYARESGNVEVTLTEDHENPGNCAQAGKVVIENSNLGKDEIVSFSLAALMADKPVTYYVAGCISIYNTTYPKALTGSISK